MTFFCNVNAEPMVFDTCPKCKTTHGFARSIYDTAQLRTSAFTITCPNGHPWHYKSKQELDAEERVRQERDKLKQQLAQKDDEIAEAKKAASAAKGQVTRLRNRAAAGMCPCCNRRFDNLQRHMASKHKDEATVQ